MLHVDTTEDAMKQIQEALATMKAAREEVQDTKEDLKKFMTDVQGALLAMPPIMNATRESMNGMHAEKKGTMSALWLGMAGNLLW